MNVIQSYAPTNDSKEEEKEQFYTRLLSVLEKFMERDVTILMGDLNAKTGNDNTGYEEVMGNHSLGDMNEYREKFAELCTSVFLQEYSKQRGCYRTTKQRTRSIMSALLRSFRGPCMWECREEPMWHQTIISSWPD